MDKLETYKEILREIITEYAGYKPRNSPHELLPICDDTTGEYILMSIEWRKRSMFSAVSCKKLDVTLRFYFF